MAASDTEILAAINDAILAIVTGRTASYSINGRSLTKLSLSELQEMKSKYEARIAAASGGMFTVSQFRDAE